MDLLQNLFKKKPGGFTSTPSGGRRKRSRSRKRSRHTRGGKGSGGGGGAGTVKGFFGGSKMTTLGFSSLVGGKRRRGTRKRGKGRRRR